MEKCVYTGRQIRCAPSWFTPVKKKRPRANITSVVAAGRCRKKGHARKVSFGQTKRIT